MVNQIKVLVDSEQVSDLLIDLMDVDGIEVEIEAYDMSPPDENRKHPEYSLMPSDITTVLIALPAIITSLTGLAKVILDYKLKAAQKEPKSKKTPQEPSIVIDSQVTPLSKFSTAEELSKFIEEKTKKTKGKKTKN